MRARCFNFDGGRMCLGRHTHLGRPSSVTGTICNACLDSKQHKASSVTRCFTIEPGAGLSFSGAPPRPVAAFAIADGHAAGQLLEQVSSIAGNSSIRQLTCFRDTGGERKGLRPSASFQLETILVAVWYLRSVQLSSNSCFERGLLRDLNARTHPSPTQATRVHTSKFRCSTSLPPICSMKSTKQTCNKIPSRCFPTSSRSFALVCNNNSEVRANKEPCQRLYPHRFLSIRRDKRWIRVVVI